MKRLLWFFIGLIFLGGFVFTLQKLAVPLPLIVRFYVNDFLIVPIVLALCLIVVRWLKSNFFYQLPLVVVLYVSIMYSVIFEWFLPQFHPRYTADIIDVMLYLLGGLVFYMLQKTKVI